MFNIETIITLFMILNLKLSVVSSGSEDIMIYRYVYKTPSPSLQGQVVTAEKQGRESHCAIR